VTYFQVDDKLHSHRKVLDLPLDAVGLWTLAGSWACDHLSEGFVPEGIVRRLGGLTGPSEALVAAGLWVQVDGGFQFHQWTEHNRSKEEVIAKREKWKADKQRKRAYGDTLSAADKNMYLSVVESKEIPGTRNKEQGTRNKTQQSIEQEHDFEIFWTTYPRKAAKPRAREAWAKAILKADPEVIIAAAAAYADDPNRVQEFTAHAATWLNQERWNDDPLPQRTVVPSVVPKSAPNIPNVREVINIQEGTSMPDWFRDKVKGNN